LATPVEHELDAPPWQRVESTLMATSRAIRRAYDARLANLDLNLTQASLLMYVQDHEPITQTQLADRLGMGRASTGAVIDNLHLRDLVQREPDPTDRRVWLVRLTSSGRELAAMVTAADVLLREELRAGLSRAERKQLARTLLRLHANLAVVLGEHV
jgi:DNA-binding MarR family transcriptional regulator